MVSSVDSDSDSPAFRNLVKQIVAPSESGLRAGDVVAGRYELVELLGRGGMGRVWRCDDRLEHREVALKEMKSSHDLWFRRELYTMAKLAHPNTVSVLDSGVLPSGQHFLVMELVRGRDLRALVRSGPLPPVEVARILVELAHVLGFIHSRLYVHCDVKADNVRITDSGALKLLDFGIMHQRGTSASARIGTPSYMAPEILEGGVIDAATDLYSLGVLGFELVTGALPYRSTDTLQLIEMHLHAPIPPLPNAPPHLAAIITKLMAKRPRDRFQHAGELLGALHVPDASVAQRASYLIAAELVGRTRELELLRERLRALGSGRARHLLVAAPGGVGKSRLVQELRLDARLADIACTVGYCRAEGQQPLQPIARAVAPLVELVPRDVLDAHRDALAGLLPHIGTPGASDNSALFASLVACLRAAARERPFIICIEDLQWADAATIGFVNVLSRALVGDPAMVVGTVRSDEVDRVSLVYKTVYEGITELLELAPLGESDTQALLDHMLRDAELPPPFSARLCATTSGNAFFITESLRALIETGTLELKAGTWRTASTIALPTTLEAAVVRRLALLDTATLAVCRTIAPIGRIVPLELVTALTGLPDYELFAHLDVLVERQFIQHGEDGDYRFTHDRLREAIVHDTPAELLRQAHQRIAQLIEKRDGDPGRIGYHYAHGSDPGKAVPYLLRAAERSLARSLDVDAVRQLRQAEPLIADPNARLLAWANLVEAGFNADPATTVEFGDKLFAAADAPRVVGEDRLAICRSVVGSVLGSLGDHERSAAIALEDLHRHPDHSDPLHATALLGRAVMLIQRGEWAQQDADARLAFDILERTAPHASRRLDWYHGQACFFLLMGQAVAGRPLDRAVLSRGFELAQSAGFADQRYWLRLTELIRATRIGDPSVADPLLAELVELVQRLGFARLMESRLYLFLPMFHAQRHEPIQLAAGIAKLESFLDVMDDSFVRLHVSMYRAFAASLAGALDAEKVTDAAIEAARARHFYQLTLLLCARAELHLQRGEREAAEGVAREALARACSAAIGSPYDHSVALRVLGEVTHDVELLRSARAVADEHGHTLLAARALFAISRTRSLADAERTDARRDATRIFTALRCDALARAASLSSGQPP